MPEPTTASYDKMMPSYFDQDIREIKYRSLSAIANWLLENSLVLPHNEAYYKAPIDSDFRLAREDLTGDGQRILDKLYEEWTLSDEAVTDPPDLSIFESALQGRY
jgi:hypothetical protein